jgi:hypothetical protein
VAAFDGWALTMDTGALLMGTTQRSIGLVDCFGTYFADLRRLELIDYEVRTQVEQRASAPRLARRT